LLPGANQRAEISLEVTINSDIPTNSVVNQASLQMTRNGASVTSLSDDPKTVNEVSDPTVTPLSQESGGQGPKRLLLPLVHNQAHRS
jgi:hypothetical protein